MLDLAVFAKNEINILVAPLLSQGNQWVRNMKKTSAKTFFGSLVSAT